MKIPNNLNLNNKEYEDIVSMVYFRASEILNNPLHIHFTDHSINHAERMLNIIDKLLEVPQILTDEEKLILICAVLLHDIGMQATNEINSMTFPLTNEQLNYIREHHHEFSEKIIKDSISFKSSSKFYLGLDSNSVFVDDIATVAKYHRKLDINSLQDDVIGNVTIRLKLLSALIRLADCLDIDFRRVKIDKLKILDIPVDSEFFWFSHHYVKGMKIENRAIELVFRFPDEYKNEKSLTSAISNYILSEINKHIEQVYTILDNYGIRLGKNINCSVQFSTTSVTSLPDNLKEYIKCKSTFYMATQKEVNNNFENKNTVTCDVLQSTSMITKIESTNLKESLTEPQYKIESDYANMTIQEKVDAAKYYIQQSEYEKAINIINFIINSNKKQYDKSTLINCYKLKCNIYNALKGNSNSLFAIICNEAVRKMLQK